MTKEVMTGVEKDVFGPPEIFGTSMIKHIWQKWHASIFV